MLKSTLWDKKNIVHVNFVWMEYIVKFTTTAETHNHVFTEAGIGWDWGSDLIDHTFGERLEYNHV